MFFRGELGCGGRESNNGVDSNSDLTNQLSVTLAHTSYLSVPVFSFGRRVDFVRTLLALRIGEQRCT